MAIGTVYSVNIKQQSDNPKGRGLPKWPVDEVLLTKDGPRGDHHIYRYQQKKVDPANRAVLIMPYEMLEQFKREGWPVNRGDLGENLTTMGIAYFEFQPERRFQVGNAIIKISHAATPCLHLALLDYVGQSKLAEFNKCLLGRRGWYASVEQEGMVKRANIIRSIDDIEK